MEIGSLNLDEYKVTVPLLYKKGVDNFEELKNAYDMVAFPLQYLWDGTALDQQPFDIVNQFGINNGLADTDSLYLWDVIDDFFDEQCAEMDTLIEVEYSPLFIHWFYTGLNEDGVYTLFLGISKGFLGIPKGIEED